MQKNTIEYRPAIDGLRALAVLAVMVYHLNRDWLPGGFVGVDVFFVVSGFLISSVILRDCKKERFSLTTFYQRRIARIFPAFLIVAIATICAASQVYSPLDFAWQGANFVGSVLSVLNMKLMVQGGEYFAISADASPFLHCWTLSLEEQFYVVFPLLLMLLHKFARKYLALILSLLCVGSFLACAIMTALKPVWAFYLLPTRAWELLAGVLLTVNIDHFRAAPEKHWPGVVSAFCLGLVALSFWAVPEGKGFPGFWALLPVVGSVGVLMPAVGRVQGCERLLAAAPLVFVGRISYSLYLWHWPVFCLVDYGMFSFAGSTRLALKVVLTFLGSVLSYVIIEKPIRAILNRPKNFLLSYGVLLGGVLLCVPLGVIIRNTDINVRVTQLSEGGRIFNSRSNKHSVILMGDSLGSMYGKTLKEICWEADAKLTVISMAGGYPLPTNSVTTNQLWVESLAVVQREKPDCLILACNWKGWLKEMNMLAQAVETLKPLVGGMIIINQPPILPNIASRQSIREGIHPPFYEDVRTRELRREANLFLEQFNNGKCMVVDAARCFEGKNGEVLFMDEYHKEYYQDFLHLTKTGADVVRPDFERAVSAFTANPPIQLSP